LLEELCGRDVHEKDRPCDYCRGNRPSTPGNKGCMGPWRQMHDVRPRGATHPRMGRLVPTAQKVQAAAQDGGAGSAAALLWQCKMASGIAVVSILHCQGAGVRGNAAALPLYCQSSGLFRTWYFSAHMGVCTSCAPIGLFGAPTPHTVPHRRTKKRGCPSTLDGCPPSCAT
jgi:hypothetical protein